MNVFLLFAIFFHGLIGAVNATDEAKDHENNHTPWFGCKKPVNSKAYHPSGDNICEKFRTGAATFYGFRVFLFGRPFDISMFFTDGAGIFYALLQMIEFFFEVIVHLMLLDRGIRKSAGGRRRQVVIRLFPPLLHHRACACVP